MCSLAFYRPNGGTMRTKRSTGRVKTDSDAIPPELLAHAKGRSSDLVKQLEKAMREIELDIEKNDGLYPYNGGRLTQAEVCRRAGIRNASLQGVRHKHTTKLDVDTFVSRVGKLQIVGSKAVRQTVTGRADAWKEAHQQIGEAYHLTILRSEKLERRIRELEAENQSLREQLARSSDEKVVPINRRKGR
ncbi:hypothetical protein LMG22931_01258 [Paraburkholderia nemoris]|nr:hypothetical protein LMG22931_01258 [Paraburkholderia nemoris]